MTTHYERIQSAWADAVHRHHAPAYVYGEVHRTDCLGDDILDAISPLIAAEALRGVATDSGAPRIAYCPDHNPDGEGALQANCDWCSALGIDQEWIELLNRRADELDEGAGR